MVEWRGLSVERKCLGIRKITKTQRALWGVTQGAKRAVLCVKNQSVTYKKLGVTPFCFNFVVKQVL